MSFGIYLWAHTDGFRRHFGLIFWPLVFLVICASSFGLFFIMVGAKSVTVYDTNAFQV